MMRPPTLATTQSTPCGWAKAGAPKSRPRISVLTPDNDVLVRERIGVKISPHPFDELKFALIKKYGPDRAPHHAQRGGAVLQLVLHEVHEVNVSAVLGHHFGLPGEPIGGILRCKWYRLL